ncbi:MAG: hypothetical protein QOH48_1429 [Actinomycetota bacterium]|jgi:hypothetical protein|nr:hypothetical protein [Actinomycetota bacterium]
MRCATSAMWLIASVLKKVQELPICRQIVDSTEEAQVNIEEVYPFAEGFLKALVTEDGELIASYLTPDLEESLNGNLDLPKGGRTYGRNC